MERLLFFCVSSISFLTFQEPEKLNTFQGKEVEIRGFLYHTDQGKWVLASEPNLRSCCQGTSKNVESQIFLEGAIAEEMPLATAHGLFTIEPRYDHEGTLIEKYHLKNATVTPINQLPLFPILGIVAACLLLALTYRIKFSR